MATLTPEEVATALEGPEWERQTLDGLRRIVITVEGNAKVRTPVLTGNLRRSLTSRIEASAKRGVVGTNVIYARVVHEGLRGHKAQPFFDQGLADSMLAINRIMQKMGDQFFAGVVRG